MLASLLSHLDLVTFQHAIQLTNVVDAIGSYVDETDGLLSWWRDLSFLNHPLVLCLLTKECGGAFRADLFELWLIITRVVLEGGLRWLIELHLVFIMLVLDGVCSCQDHLQVQLILQVLSVKIEKD